MPLPTLPGMPPLVVPDQQLSDLSSGLMTVDWYTFFDRLARRLNAVESTGAILGQLTINGEAPDEDGAFLLPYEVIGEVVGLVDIDSNTTLDVDIHKGRYLLVTGSRTITAPSAATSDFPPGSWVNVINAGSGVITFAEGSGATLESPDSMVTLEMPNGGATLLKIAADTWHLEGRIA